MGKLLPTDAKIRVRKVSPPEVSIDTFEVGGRRFLAVGLEDRWQLKIVDPDGKGFDERDVNWLRDTIEAKLKEDGHD